MLVTMVVCQNTTQVEPNMITHFLQTDIQVNLLRLRTAAAVLAEGSDEDHVYDFDRRCRVCGEIWHHGCGDAGGVRLFGGRGGGYHGRTGAG